MMRSVLIPLILLISINTYSQLPGMPQQGNRGAGGMNREQMNVGRFYGKIVDANTNKPIEYATVQLNGGKWDSTAKAMKTVILGGQMTAANGDFSIEKLPPFGEFTLKITAIGYQPLEQKVKFDLKIDLNKGFDMQKAMQAVDKDLGNIRLQPSTQLKEVVIEGGDPSFKLDIDKKVFNVEKNPISSGGTAEDVLKTVPSVNVDMDGNVTLRNSSPQIFVDGRPSTLSMEQIPADAIQSVELITNPSAKYDASGGMGGIINIVLKKNRKLGYNGGVRAGIDKRGRLNGGGDLNVRDGKVNLFIMGHAGQRKSIATGTTDRYNFNVNPLTNVHQQSRQVSTGLFGFTRFGMDYFIDNRNTLTISQSFSGGRFEPVDELTILTDTISSAGVSSSQSRRSSETWRDFTNRGTSLSYKHLFPEEGKEFTTDINYNASRNAFGGDYFTNFYDANDQLLPFEMKQKQNGSGSMGFITVQSDFVNPLTEKIKLEMGARAAFRNYESLNENFLVMNEALIRLPSMTNNYEFSDRVLAAYGTLSQRLNKMSYQLGLRVESSEYSGTLLLEDSAATFTNSYPISLFPSASLTYELNDNDDLQLSYTRRVNRPNFFQLIPFTDYTDSLNISRGNPDLRPEFTHALEASYLNTLNQKNNILFSVYYRESRGIVTQYQFQEYNDVLGRDALIMSYKNANSSTSYGVELTSKNGLNNWLDLTTNLNIFNAIIDGQNIEGALRVEQLAWFGKINANFKMPKNFSFQFTGDYQSKTALQASSGSRGGGGGMRMGGFFMGGGNTGSAQGYIKPSYSLDFSIKKDFLKNKMATITLNFIDIFRTRVNNTHSESFYFSQDTHRRRDPQFIRLNFSYRFGKFDVSLFKRKNMKNMMDGMQDIPMQ